jgi:hypothetical protein
MVRVANVEATCACHPQVRVAHAHRDTHTLESFASRPMKHCWLMTIARVDDWCRRCFSGRTGARQRGTRVQWPQQRRSWHQRLHSGSHPLSREPRL